MIQQLIVEARRNPHLSGQLWTDVNTVMGRCQSKQSGINDTLSLDSVMTL